MLEDAQKQAGRAGQTIADETLLLFASIAMLTTERYPRSKYDWEDGQFSLTPSPVGVSHQRVPHAWLSPHLNMGGAPV